MSVMYIIEVFIKWLNKRETKEIKYEKPSFEEVDEALTCQHNFMPVDSTGDVLACTKCGFVVKKKDKQF
ncbi:hypothetical protein IJD34_05735 [bacterium]|nr:hypothetical protein [bacterium]